MCTLVAEPRAKVRIMASLFCKKGKAGDFQLVGARRLDFDFEVATRARNKKQNTRYFIIKINNKRSISRRKVISSVVPCSSFSLRSILEVIL